MIVSFFFFTVYIVLKTVGSRIILSSNQKRCFNSRVLFSLFLFFLTPNIFRACVAPPFDIFLYILACACIGVLAGITCPCRVPAPFMRMRASVYVLYKKKGKEETSDFLRSASFHVTFFNYNYCINITLCRDAI